MADGTKTWITKARHVGLVALLCKTDSKARPTQRGSNILLMEKAPGLTVSKDLPKLGNGTFDRVTARVMDEFGAAHRY